MTGGRLGEAASPLAGDDFASRSSDSTAGQPAGGRGVIAALTAASVVVGLGVMPFVYDLVAFRGHWAPLIKPPVPEHLALNILANLVVMFSAILLTGPLDRRLAAVFTRTLTVHGALAFLILVTRQWYSIPILLTGVASSSVAGAVMTAIRQSRVRLRVGVIGPPARLVADPALDCTLIEDPDEAISRFDLIVLTTQGEPPAVWLPTIARALAAGKRIRPISDFLEETGGYLSIDHFALDQLPEGGITSYRSRKRLFDLVSAVILAPFAAVIVAFAALGVLITMGRPILFSQPRVGLGGRVFQIVKLRTMRPQSTAQGIGSVATAIGDARITPFGGWLRRLHIDELPQLWNVLRGDMSVVGPRPEQPGLTERYCREVPAFAFRNLVRPGITGWAQVRAGYAANLAETRVKLGYDLFYLKHISFSLDLQILVRTVWTLIAGGGVR